MKKLLIVLNIFFPVLALTCATFYSINGEMWLKWMSGLGFVLQGIINFIFLIRFRPDKKLYGILMLAGLILSYFASMLIHYYIVWTMILFALVSILLYLSNSLIICVKPVDFVYGICIAIPMMFLMIFSGIFGFVTVWVEVFVILYVVLISLVLGKTISNIVRERNVITSIQFVSTLLFYAANFIMLCNAFSKVSHFIMIVFTGLFVISHFMYSYTVFHMGLSKDCEVESYSFKEDVKRNKWKIVVLALVVLFVGYSTVISFNNFNIANAKVYKTQFLAMMGEDLNIPLVEINTENNEFPTSKEEYVNADFSISNCENPEDNFSVDMAKNYGDEGSVGIRLRGNSTKLARKKPFRIKFDEKKSFFGLKKNKSWVLLADYYDQSYLRNYTALTIADAFDNLDFTPTPHHVAVIINGEFQGLYLLCEQIDEKSGRTGVEEDFDVNKDTEFPFLVEMDQKAYKEGVTGIDNFYVEGFQPVEIKYPEADERDATKDSDKVFDYIYEYITAVFKTLQTGEPVEVTFRENPVVFEDLVDVDSAVDYYLMTEIMLNPDASAKSIYFHKTKDGKMQFGPIWDYDFSMTNIFEVPYKQSFIETAKTLYTAHAPIYSKLLEREDFYNKVANRYNELSSKILDVVEHLRIYKSKIDNVALIDAKMWHGETGKFQYDSQYDYVRLYLQDRYGFLNYIFSLSYSEYHAIT